MPTHDSKGRGGERKRAREREGGGGRKGGREEEGKRGRNHTFARLAGRMHGRRRVHAERGKPHGHA